MAKLGDIVIVGKPEGEWMGWAGPLVVLARKEYETLVRKQPKYIPVVELTASEKRIIARGEKELARGEYVMLEDLEHELGGARAKRSS
ncbi:MAG: hypothetical protein WAP52_01615 [Candidatus Sungiibacteriota bacterium]